MPARRSTAYVFALLVLLAGALPVAASAFPPGSLAPAPAFRAAERTTTAVQERLRLSGVYDISVTVTTASSVAGDVSFKIGPLARHAAIDARAHKAKLTLRLAIGRRDFTIRATAARLRPHLRVTLLRIGDVAPGTAAGSIALAADAPATVATRASSTVGRQPNVPTAAGPTGPTGSAGSSASAPQQTASPVAPAPTTSPTGSPIISLPGSFAPVASYTNPAQDYEFTGSSLPSDWSPGANSSHGFAATLFQPSQVAMTGSSVALTATDQASQGYPDQSGWISTEGHYSLTHGLIDFRAKMPAGQGLWSGLWLDQPDGSNPWGEIDVQEMLLGNTHSVNGSLHNWAPNPYWGETQTTWMAADASQGFHDYQIVWQPGMITWAIDGVAYAQYTEAQAIAQGQPWPFDDGSGFYLIADLAVGAPSDWGGAPNASTVFPASMQVQSVKVWQ